MRLSDYSVLTFDCYGTLIDWESGIVQALQPWLERAGAASGPRADPGGLRASRSAAAGGDPGLPYPELLAGVHGAIAAHFGVAPDPGAAQAFGASIEDWPAFPDSAEALAYLKRHYRLVILSNVDRAPSPTANGSSGSRSTRSTPPRTSAPTSPTRAISSTCWPGSPSRASPASRSCTPRNRSTTITCRPSASASPPAGSTGAPARRAMAPPTGRTPRFTPTSVSRRSPRWRRRAAPRAPDSAGIAATATHFSR